jgi:hypothetical protein
LWFARAARRNAWSAFDDDFVNCAALALCLLHFAALVGLSLSFITTGCGALAGA